MFGEWSQLRHSPRSLDRAAAFLGQVGISDSLERTATLGVVGSKGKGTGAIYASATLSAADLTVGTITSPGLVSNRDRVRLNGQILSDGHYRAMLQRVIDTRASLPTPDAESGYLSPSGLYMLGGIATLLQLGCNVLVLEAGIGGTADELSLVALDGVIVTQIFLEHAEVIGPTTVDIARNKVGVISERTKFVVSLDQSPDVRPVIEAKCGETGSNLHWVDGAADSALLFPPGFSRANAAAGVRAGSELAQMMTGTNLALDRLRPVIESVNYPGRLSTHEYKGHRVLVDSAISRDGLVMALVFAKAHFGTPPSTVYLAIPSNKDFGGCLEELRDVGARKVFVNMPDSHLPFPGRDDWPWEWIDLDTFESDLAVSGDSLVVGTATFTADVLRFLGAGSKPVFEP